jgi:hypothetical protein
MKLPEKPALPLVGNCLDFTIKNLCICFQEFKEFLLTYDPVTRLWLDPLLSVELIETKDIEITKLSGPDFRNRLPVIDGVNWRAHRKIVSSDHNTKVLETFREFLKNSDTLANMLKALNDGTTANEIVPYFTS